MVTFPGISANRHWNLSKVMRSVESTVTTLSSHRTQSPFYGYEFQFQRIGGEGLGTNLSFHSVVNLRCTKRRGPIESWKSGYSLTLLLSDVERDWD